MIHAYINYNKIVVIWLIYFLNIKFFDWQITLENKRCVSTGEENTISITRDKRSVCHSRPLRHFQKARRNPSYSAVCMFLSNSICNSTQKVTQNCHSIWFMFTVTFFSSNKFNIPEHSTSMWRTNQSSWAVNHNNWIIRSLSWC